MRAAAHQSWFGPMEVKASVGGGNRDELSHSSLLDHQGGASKLGDLPDQEGTACWNERWNRIHCRIGIGVSIWILTF